MLRRKLLFNFGPLVMLLIGTAIAAIWLLQGVLRDMDHINTKAWVLVEKVNELSIEVNHVEIVLYQIQLGREGHLDALIDSVDSVRALVKDVGEFYLVGGGEAALRYRTLAGGLPEFERHVGALATVQDREMARYHNDAAMNAAVAIRMDTLPLARLARAHAHAEQGDLANWFRWLVLGLAIVFLLEVNVTVLMLMRMGGTVLKPVDKLLEATRRLGEGKYEHRVQFQQHDEFDELARAYNSLAENLQANEARKMEVLRQVALAMNHELNNALAIIQMQLQRLGREATGNPALENRLREIQQSLQRMTESVKALRDARRIVLTDYVPGTKMLDLRRSAEPEEATANL